jgi:hypothetical protein
MGMMKKIHYMLENDFSEDKIAWFIFLAGTGNWYKCKDIARDMRNDYENTKKGIGTDEQTE